MTSNNAYTPITKVLAAKRQIQAAIRLFFSKEDELAIHTIASAAYGLVKGLKHSRGQNEAAEIYRTTIFYLIRDFRRGTLPKDFADDPTIMSEVEKIAYQLSSITAESKLSDVAKATIPPDLEKEYWRENNRTANFLKHADQDPDGTLSRGQIDNYQLLLKCTSAYFDIDDDLGNEGFAFSLFAAANNSSYRSMEPAFNHLIHLMDRIPSPHRLDFFNELIFELNAGSRIPGEHG